MVTLQDIIDTIMLDSGQFIMDFEDTLIDRKTLIRIIKRELQVYNRYYPRVTSGIFNLYNGKEFTEATDKVVPDTIIEIRNTSNDLYSTMFNGSSTMYGMVSTVNWRYDNPILLFQYPEGQYYVSYLVYHKWDDERKRIMTMQSEFPGTERYFIDLVTGKFMEAMGRSRTAFTISGMPVDTNANDLISRGQDLYSFTLETMKINSYYHLAVIA